MFPKRANGPGDFLPASASLRTRKHTNEEEHASETITGVALAATNHERDEAFAFAERLKSIFESHTFDVAGTKERFTISVGVGLWPEHGADFQTVLNALTARSEQPKRRGGTASDSLNDMAQSIAVASF